MRMPSTMLSAATGYNPAAAAAAAQAQSQSAAGAWGNMGYPLYRFAGPPQAYGSFVQSTGYGKRNRDRYDAQPQLSDTNIYIRGLDANTTDKDLKSMCEQYGPIASTKAITDKATGKCKGYGFVDFEAKDGAESALKGLQTRGIQAQMAKMAQTRTAQQAPAPREPVEREQDPTNLYIANLPLIWTEQNIQQLFQPFGMVISTRILRNPNGESRGVGFARMESREKCEQIINHFNGKKVPGIQEPLLVKFADGGRKARQRAAMDNQGMNGFQMSYDPTQAALAAGQLQNAMFNPAAAMGFAAQRAGFPSAATYPTMFYNPGAAGAAAGGTGYFPPPAQNFYGASDLSSLMQQMSMNGHQNGAPHSGGQAQGGSATPGSVQAGGSTPAVQYMMYGAAGAPYYMPMSAESMQAAGDHHHEAGGYGHAPHGYQGGHNGK